VDKFSKNASFEIGFQNRWETFCPSSKCFAKTWQNHQNCNNIRVDGPKKNWASPHNKVDLAEICSKEMSANSLSHHTNIKDKLKVQP
jgi:hypothetical protein